MSNGSGRKPANGGIGVFGVMDMRGKLRLAGTDSINNWVVRLLLSSRAAAAFGRSADRPRRKFDNGWSDIICCTFERTTVSRQNCCSVYIYLYTTIIYSMINLDRISGFEWDDGNNRKSADKHDVSQAEAENVFFNDPLIVVEDVKHSETEQPLNALGKTAQNRLLHITFTLRQNGTMVRIISARDMHRKERKIYEQA